MRNEFTAIVEQDGPWYVACCAEVPGANAQGKSREECIANLREAIALILEYRREESRSCPRIPIGNSLSGDETRRADPAPAS
jgi:predicted RNase H-like HicB family nuclease